MIRIINENEINQVSGGCLSCYCLGLGYGGANYEDKGLMFYQFMRSASSCDSLFNPIIPISYS